MAGFRRDRIFWLIVFVGLSQLTQIVGLAGFINYSTQERARICDVLQDDFSRVHAEALGRRFGLGADHPEVVAYREDIERSLADCD